MAKDSDIRSRGADQALGFSEALGRTIKVIRTDLGVERRELAAKAGISYSYLTEIENGNKPPSSSVLAPIASALGLRMSQLIDAAEARVDRQNVAERSEGSPVVGLSTGQKASVPQPRAAAATPQETGEALVETGAPSGPSRDYSVDPTEKASTRDVRAALNELEIMLGEMTIEDVERVLQYVRWVAH